MCHKTSLAFPYTSCLQRPISPSQKFAITTVIFVITNVSNFVSQDLSFANYNLQIPIFFTFSFVVNNFSIQTNF